LMRLMRGSSAVLMCASRASVVRLSVQICLLMTAALSNDVRLLPGAIDVIIP